MSTTSSALDGLDPILNAPKRLGIMAVLTSSTSADFTFLRAHLGVSDSDLSKQASVLQAAGYITITKSGRGRGSTTAYKTTTLGRKAYHQHRAALRGLLGE